MATFAAVESRPPEARGFHGEWLANVQGRKE